MPHQRITSTILAAGIALVAGAASAQQTDSMSDAVRIATSQNATIGLIDGGAGSTDARVAADIADVLGDGDRLRILPMIGHGSIQNIADLIYLKGVDVAIVHTDVLTATMQRGTIPEKLRFNTSPDCSPRKFIFSPVRISTV